ncbi:hypothetical protein QPK87_17450 [Kamptonema cortianum]|nr:hypothetical protein [Geitlerinema splendidum]MDK3158341.1 hypothetical protein [Kamptonema cortianum]
MRRVLEQVLKTRELIGVHKYADDPSIFIVGRVVAIENEYFFLHEVDPHGRWESDRENEWISIESVCQITRGSAYLQSLAAVAEIDDKAPREVTCRGSRRISAIVDRAIQGQSCVEVKIPRDQPFVLLPTGREGKFVTGVVIRDYLYRECEATISIDVMTYVRMGSKNCWLSDRAIKSLTPLPASGVMSSSE